MNKWIAAAALTLAVPMASAKVLISIDGGAGYSMNSLSDSSTLANKTVNLAGTSSTEPYGLGMEADPAFYGWAKVSVPLLPDVKVKYETMKLTGSNNVNFNLAFGPETITVDGEVESSLDLSHLDLALTIGLPLPVVDIDFGVNTRSMLGGFNINGAINGETAAEKTVDFVWPNSDMPLIIPMGYVSAAATIPGAGVKVGGELSTLPLGDTKFTDWNIKGTWYAPLPTNLLVKLGVEGGYRSFSMTIGDSTLGADTSELASDVTVGGFFVGAALAF